MVLLVGGEVGEHRRVLERGSHPGADRDEEGVERDLRVVVRLDALPVQVHAGKTGLDPARVLVVGNALQRIPAHTAQGERLPYGEGAVGDLVVGREDRNVDVLPGEPAQAKQPLDGGDASSADDGVQATHVPSSSLTFSASTRPCVERVADEFRAGGAAKLLLDVGAVRLDGADAEV